MIALIACNHVPHSDVGSGTSGSSQGDETPGPGSGTRGDEVSTGADSSGAGESASGDVDSSGGTGDDPGEGEVVALVLEAADPFASTARSASTVRVGDGEAWLDNVLPELRFGRELGLSYVDPTGSWAFLAVQDQISGANGDAMLVSLDGGREVALDVDPVPTDGAYWADSFSEDGGWLAFNATPAGGNDDRSLWMVPLLPRPGIPQALHPPLPPGASVGSARFSPDGDAALFTADLDGTGAVDLYLATLPPDDLVNLSGHTLPEQQVNNFSGAWRPDGSGVVYRADTETDGVSELYYVDLDGGAAATPVKVNLPLADGETLASGSFSPDGLYVAFQLRNGGLADWYLADLVDGVPGVPFPVSGPDPWQVEGAGGWAPELSALVYTARHGGPDTLDAYLVHVEASGAAAPVQLNEPLATGGEVEAIQRVPGGGSLLYFAADDDAGDGLYRVPVTDGIAGPPERISDPVEAPADLVGFAIVAPDASSLVYLLDPGDGAAQQAWFVDLQVGVGAPVRLELPERGRAAGFPIYSQDATVLLIPQRTVGPSDQGWLSIAFIGPDGPGPLSDLTDRLRELRPVPPLH